MISLYIYGLMVVLLMMTLLWIVSVILKNAGIVDIFWGLTFVLMNAVYLLMSEDMSVRQIILTALVSVWGLRLAIHILIRNAGKGEDFRYQQFRKDYGAERYWWVSFFQVFVLQGILSWLVSAPLAAVNSQGSTIPINFLDYIGICVWLFGFIFETGSDIQLARFKSNPLNKGKILDRGFWKYSRHPNYFGDSAAWWGYGLICIASGSYLPVFGSLLMTFLIIKISGVSLLEKTLKSDKPGYDEYVRKTSAFLPWFPKKK